jgi:hypothetical protein
LSALSIYLKRRPVSRYEVGMLHDRLSVVTMVLFGRMVAAGCRSTFRAGINHRLNASAGGDPEVGADIGPDLAAGDEPPGSDVESDGGEQVKTPKLELLVGGLGGPGNRDGIGSTARFDTPTGVTSDGAGNLSVAEVLNHTIRNLPSADLLTLWTQSAWPSRAQSSLPLPASQMRTVESSDPVTTVFPSGDQATA